MKKLALVFILCSPFIIFAQESPTDKAIVCMACHDSNGVGTRPEWPNLGGQNVKYLVKQLQEMKEGKHRNSPFMSAVLAQLKAEDLDDLAAHYAKMPVVEGSTPKKYVARGEALYRGGDFSKHITACIACHGPKGTGNAQAGFPSLSGQHAAYTIMQLEWFKEGKRTNDLNHIMQDISKRMSKEDMDAVAHYIEGLY